MSSIKLTADSGGGTFEIKAPSSSGNTRVLTLPDTGNLTLNGGKILQVVQTVKKDKTTIQSTSLVDIAGMSVTITPSSASNKVLIRYCVSAFTNNQYWAMRLHSYDSSMPRYNIAENSHIPHCKAMIPRTIVVIVTPRNRNAIASS